MNDRNREQVERRTDVAEGGDARDSQADGVADEAAAAGSGTKEDALAQPGTNRGAVPGGLEGSIMEGEDADNAADGGDESLSP